MVRFLLEMRKSKDTLLFQASLSELSKKETEIGSEKTQSIKQLLINKSYKSKHFIF